jgi:hypothetical protein
MQPAPTAPCFFPLATQAAQQEYSSIAETMVRAGRMDVHNHRLLSSYVAQLDNIIVAQQQKRQIRGSWFTQMDRARNKLKLHELENHLQPVIERPPNKFAPRSGGSFEQRLVHAHEAGQVGQPLRDPELALDRGIDPAVHPALDRLIDSAREVSPAAEAHRDLIGEVPSIPAIEKVADGLIAATRALRDPGYSQRPRLIGLCVLPASAASGFDFARDRFPYPVLHPRSPGSVTACTLFRDRK